MLVFLLDRLVCVSLSINPSINNFVFNGDDQSRTRVCLMILCWRVLCACGDLDDQVTMIMVLWRLGGNHLATHYFAVSGSLRY